MTKPRIAMPRGTLGVTRRTNERKLLWTPSSSAVHEGFLYALAIAQERARFELHHGVLLPTHEHLTLTPGWETDIGEAFRWVHRESARFLQEHLLASGYDAPQAVWDKRSTHAMHLVDAGAQLEWLLYSVLNVLEAGLVEQVRDWPGWVSALGLLKGGVVVVKRPEVYFGSDQPAERELVFTPPPELARLFGSELEGVVYWLHKQVEWRERDLRGRDVVGASRVPRIDPFAEPRTCRERRGQRIPRYKVGRGWAPEERKTLLEQLRGEDARFLVESAHAWRSWCGGDRDAVFPYGTLQMVSQQGARCADAHPDAVLCAAERTATYGSGGSIADDVKRASEASREELDLVELDASSCFDMAHAGRATSLTPPRAARAGVGSGRRGGPL